jgi:hypothetical protein
VNGLIERYVSMWNEGDGEARRRLIETVWTPDGANFTKSNGWRGYEALEARVRGAHEKWVRDGGYVFRARGTEAHHGAARFVWEMVSITDGHVESVGTELLLLAPDGRIREDYQFLEAAT